MDSALGDQPDRSEGDNNVDAMTAAPATTTLSPAVSAGETENIAVCIRVRPLNEREVRSRDCNVLRTINAMNMITITDVDGTPLSGKHNVFQYDHIYDETRSTRHMYNQVARRIVRSTLEGINGTIFAYGQTSSGKTYTMQGSDSSSSSGGSASPTDRDASSVGILQLAVDDIFAYIESCRDRDFLLRVSFVEIYNEVVRDLLAPSDRSGNNNNNGLKLREDPRKGVYVECREEIITSFDDILALLALGNERRTVGQTAMNDRSSRSHSIFRIVVESKRKAASASMPSASTPTSTVARRSSEDDVSGAVLVACLSLVDLAGSESVRHTAAEGIRQREAGNINKSLLTLSRVINALAGAAAGAPPRQSAPFRDSKLTRLLQNSLDGNTRTLIVCCVTPSDRFLDETKSTLQFAARAKTITTSASVNEVLDDQAQLKRLKREVHELKKLVNTDALSALKAENEALVHEQSRRQREYARLMGLILTSTAASTASAASGRPASERKAVKRTRETWCPGDFPAALRRSSGSGSDPHHHTASPNRQPRKRRSNSDVLKENVVPTNLLNTLDGDDDDDDCDDDGLEDCSDGRSRRQRRNASQSHALTARLLGLLELALVHFREGSGDGSDDDLDAAVEHVHEFVTRTEDQARLAELLQELQTLVGDANETQHLRGESELQSMQVRELHRRLEQLGGGGTDTDGTGTDNSTSNNNDDDGISEPFEALRLELSASQQQIEQLVAEKQRAVDDAAALAHQVETLRAEMDAHCAAFKTETAKQCATFKAETNEQQAAFTAETDRYVLNLEALRDEITQLQQAATAHSELEEQFTTARDEKLALAAQVDTLEAELAQVRSAHSLATNGGTDTETRDSADSAALASELQRLLQDLEQVTIEKQAAAAELECLRTELEYAANERAAREINIQDLSDERSALADALRSLKGEMDQVVGASTRSAERLEIEVVELRAARDARERDATALQRKLEAAGDELARLKAKLIEVDDDKQALLATVASLEALKPKLQELLGERETHATQVAALEQQLQTLQAEKSSWCEGSDDHTDALSAELAAVREAHASVSLRAAELESRLASASECATLMTELREYEVTVANQASAIEQLRAELALGDEDHAALQQRVQQLEQQAEVHASTVSELTEATAAAATVAAAAEQSDPPSSSSDFGSGASESEQLQQRITAMETERQRLETELEQVSVQRRDLFEELSALELQLMDESQEKLRLTQAVEALEKQLRDASASANGTDDTELARAKHAEAALLNELEQLTALMEKLEAENKALHEQMAGSSSGASAGASTSGEPHDDVVALQARLEIEAELRATLELDVKSYEETLQVVRHELTGSSDTIAELLEKLQVMESDATALRAAKESAERDCETVRELLARAKEEQHELRYQHQQRVLSSEQTDRSLHDTVASLESQLRDAQQVIQSQQQQQRDVAAPTVQQLEKTIADLQHELLAARKAVAVADDTWSAKLSASEQQFQTECERLQDANNKLTQQLRDLDASWRQRELELGAQVAAELQSAQTALRDALSAKQALSEQLHELEAQWRAKEQALREQVGTELESLREQCHDTQEELDSYTKYADDEIHKLRAALEASDLELQEVTRAASERESELATRVTEREANRAQLESAHAELEREVSELYAQRKALELKLEALLTSRDDAVEQLTRELEDAVAKCERADAQVAEARDAARATRTAIETLESEAYARRNELEDLAEALKSAQLEARHYETQVADALAGRRELEALVETQRQRIDKLEKVKMTTETLALFRKLKRDREELQSQVAAFDAAHSEQTASHARVLAELRDAVDRAQHEVADREDALRELQQQVAALEAQVATLAGEKAELLSHRSNDVTYLETTNLELLVENRQLKKRLDARGSGGGSEALGATRSLLDDDTHDASAAAAAAILADTGEQTVAPALKSAAVAPQSSVSAFLQTSSDAAPTSQADDSDARPACAQQ